MSKKRVIVVISVIVVAIAVVSLYQTFATSSTATSTDDNTYSINLGDSSTVTVPANSSKTIYYKLTNTNNGIVNYGIGYSGTDIVVYEWDDSNDPVTGTIDYQENKFIKLYIKNNGSVSSTATISAILGYENDENLIIPSGYAFVTNIYTPPPSGATLISNLYSPTKTATNNNITYNLDDTNKLMEDIDGNLRYYGASPKNYIYFNCGVYPETKCETWRIIGVFDGKIKIMKNSLIDSLSWDQDINQTGVDGHKNDWSNSSLRDLLNDAYYHGDTSGTVIYYNNVGITGTPSTTTLNMTNIGIKNNKTRSLISESTYHLRGFNSYSVYPDQIYNYEKKDGSLYDSTWQTSIKDKVALPYLSDYGYAADLSLCIEKSVCYYDDSTCASNNWMYPILGTSLSGWLLTPGSKNPSGAWAVREGGWANAGEDSAVLEHGVSPVLYLKFNVVIDLNNGDGTSNNPYRISVS